MQLTMGKFQGKPTIKGHYYGDYSNNCELTYDELNGHCFIHVEKHFGRFWLEIQTKGAVTSMIVKDFQQFIDYALSDNCCLLVIWWDNSSDSFIYDSERIVIKDDHNKTAVFNNYTPHLEFKEFKTKMRGESK